MAEATVLSWRRNDSAVDSFRVALISNDLVHAVIDQPVRDVFLRAAGSLVDAQLEASTGAYGRIGPFGLNSHTG